MARAYLSLGSNEGDRMAELCAGVRLLAERGVRVRRVSGVYETAPVGFADQPAFLNAVVEVETELPPRALLAAMLAVERERGRRREIRWGPRTLDVDLLLYDDLVLAEPDLCVPHPRLHERRFVLLPLLELDPEIAIPGIGPARACLDSLDAGAQPAVRLGTLICG